MIKETDGPAFPTQHYTTNGEVQWGSDGMTLRDYFAAKAMQAHIVGRGEFADSHKQTIAECSYEMADAMLEARKA